MIFISRYKSFRLTLRSTTKERAQTAAGGEDVITHRGVIIEFQNAVFDTRNWQQHSRPDSPDRINVIQSEDDLIRLMKASPYFGTDFYERVIETKEMKKARLLEELAKIDQEEDAEDLPVIQQSNLGKVQNGARHTGVFEDTGEAFPKADQEPLKTGSKPAAKKKVAAKKVPSKNSTSKTSRVEI